MLDFSGITINTGTADRVVTNPILEVDASGALLVQNADIEGLESHDESFEVFSVQGGSLEFDSVVVEDVATEIHYTKYLVASKSSSTISFTNFESKNSDA